MTKTQAIEAMKNGFKVTHPYFGNLIDISSDPEGHYFKQEKEEIAVDSQTFWFLRKEPFWEIGWTLSENQK